MKRLILIAGAFLLLSPILSFEALYRYELSRLDHTLRPVEPSPELLQDALWLAHGETLNAGVTRLWAGNYSHWPAHPGASAAGQFAFQCMPDDLTTLEKHLARAALTVWFSRHMSESEMKQQLPENTRFDGGRASGAFAAAAVTFHKRLEQLTPAEIATLAALSSSTSSNPERVRRARDGILMKLHESRRLTDQQFKEALASP